MQLSRIDRRYAHIPVTATLHDGTPATIVGVDVAVLARSAHPGPTTTWTPAVYANGDATILLAGPDADQTGAVPVPADGADVYIRVTDSPEVQAVKVGRIYIS